MKYTNQIFSTGEQARSEPICVLLYLFQLNVVKTWAFWIRLIDGQVILSILMIAAII